MFKFFRKKIIYHECKLISYKFSIDNTSLVKLKSNNNKEIKNNILLIFNQRKISGNSLLLKKQKFKTINNILKFKKQKVFYCSNKIKVINTEKHKNDFSIRYTVISEFLVNGVLTKNIRFNFLNECVTKEIHLNSNKFNLWLLKYNSNNISKKVDVIQKLSAIEYCKCIKELDDLFINILKLTKNNSFNFSNSFSLDENELTENNYQLKKDFKLVKEEHKMLMIDKFLSSFKNGR